MINFARVARIAVVTAAGLSLATEVARAEDSEKLSALEIFDSALARFEANREALEKWQYCQTLTTQQVDSSGKIVAQGRWQSIVRPGDSGPLEYTSKQVEGKISFFEAGTEESETGRVAKAPAPKKKEENQVESAVEAVRKYNLRNRYNWIRLADGMTAGETAYVLSFAPKAKQNTSTREERFFGLLAGQMWVSQRDFTVLKAEGSLLAPCSLFWIVARVTTFRFTYQLEPATGDNRLLRRSRATAKTVVSFPFFKVRQQHWQTVDKYEARRARGSSLGTR